MQQDSKDLLLSLVIAQLVEAGIEYEIPHKDIIEVKFHGTLRSKKVIVKDMKPLYFDVSIKTTYNQSTHSYCVLNILNSIKSICSAANVVSEQIIIDSL